MDFIELLSKKSYHYELPKELIAQYPLKDRSSAKLMVINKETKSIEHKSFNDILDYLNPDDVLVLNTTRVISARLFGKKESGGKIEILLVTPKSEDEWICMVKPGKRLNSGHKIYINPYLSAEILSFVDDGMRLIKFIPTPTKNTFENSPHLPMADLLEKSGHIPLPPYISRKSDDFDQISYQTVYAKQKGSIAAPTAGLHFTNELLQKIKAKGIKIAEVVLHVGLGTFKPVETDNIIDHKMHSELCEISKETAKIINDAKISQKKVISVGTTTTRTLESFAKGSKLEYGTKRTDIFIYPGKKLNIIDALITNFHLPESTLLMLVSAFAGYELAMTAYKKAISEKYRFYSYGDAMLIY